MEILVLGGTAWVGREVAAQGVARGHGVTCLARGSSGGVADGARLVVGDRTRPGAYDEVVGREWDAVVDVARQPGQVRSAVEVVRARHWTFVSTGNVYADFGTPYADESSPVRRALAEDEAGPEEYGEGKVACEQALSAVLGDRLLVARAGLIGGPGDRSDRAGAWVARAARAPEEAMLVPDTPELDTAVVDVRDLATWLLDCAERGVTGVYDAVGPVVPFGEWIALAREIGGHTGPVRLAPREWLEQQGVEQYMGPESLTMWLTEPGYEGWSNRSGQAALAAGLRHRPRRDLVTDTLVWERELGLERDRRAGLSLRREQELIAALEGAQGRT